MADNRVLLGRSIQSPTDNQKRHVVIVPGQQSKDFVVTARCRIMNVGEKLTISASDLPGDKGGSYSWETNSDKIRVSPATGAKVTVEALMVPSASRDAETIIVTRTGKDGTKKTKTVSITVARVTFGPSLSQAYGYDDYDTPLNCSDDHVSIASLGATSVAVTIEGGARGDDFNFECDDPSICTVEPPPALAAFDLKLQARECQKEETKLRAKGRCKPPTTFAQIAVNVYNETLVKVVVAKVVDLSSPKTALKFASEDYTKAEREYNNKLKQAVVKIQMRNYHIANRVSNVPYDDNNDGALNYDIAANGADQKNLLKKALHCDEDEILIVIVRNMTSNYYLELPAKKGDKTLQVRGSRVFNTKMTLGTGSTKEDVEVITSTGNVADLASPLNFDHRVGETLEFSAIGWSEKPVVLVAENDGTVEDVKKTIVHEALHTALGLKDIIDPTNIMHPNKSTTSERLRHIGRPIRYNNNNNGTQSQWDYIDRPDPFSQSGQ